MPSSQRPFFLSSFLAAFRAPTPTSLSATAAQTSKPQQAQQPTSPPVGGARSITTSTSTAQQAAPSVRSQIPLHSPRTHAAIPIPEHHRRGSDSSSEGFRDVIGGEKWYIGGRTAAGEEKYFKLGVVRRIRSKDRLSLDRLSL